MNNSIAGEQRLHPVFQNIIGHFSPIPRISPIPEEVKKIIADGYPVIDSIDTDTGKKFVVISWHWSYENDSIQQRTIVRLIEWNRQIEFEKILHPDTKSFDSAAKYFLMVEEIIPMSDEYLVEPDFKNY